MPVSLCNDCLFREADVDDKSKKGSIDGPIRDLMEEMNGHEMLSTTSSCSGRVTLFSDGDESSEKKGGDWIYSSHEAPNLIEMHRAILAFLEASQKSEKCNLVGIV